MRLDQLDVALIGALRDNPRAGPLELSRVTGVARATAASRLARLEDSGVIVGYGPDVDLTAAGYHVSAFVTLEIAQGALDEIKAELEAIPGVVEAYATTGVGDVLVRVVARSHGGLQEMLVELNRSPAIARTTSVVVLSVIVPPRVLPLLATGVDASGTRAPAYRVRPHD